MLRVHFEARVLFKDPLVFSRADRLTNVLLRCLALLNANFALIWRPEVGRCLALATESLFKLRWMEHIYKGSRGTLTCKYDFLFSLRVDEHLDRFVESTLTPAYMSVETAVKEVHEISLAECAKGDKRFARD